MDSKSLLFPTRSTFEKCLGREFIIAGFNRYGMTELEIESVTGNFGDSIWVELQFLEVLPYEQFSPCLRDSVVQ
jgi:hypothetical protein